MVSMLDLMAMEVTLPLSPVGITDGDSWVICSISCIATRVWASSTETSDEARPDQLCTLLA